LKLTTWLLPYQAITNPTPTPVFLDLHLFRQKQGAVLPTNTVLGNYYQFGDTSVSPIGNILDLNYDVNKDEFVEYKVYRKKLGFAAYVASPGGIPGEGYYSNNDSELSDLTSIDITSYLPKYIDWTDTSSVPFSDPLFMWVQAVAQDGTTENNGVAPLQMNYQIILEYTDA
jgi:hypothetical protein